MGSRDKQYIKVGIFVTIATLFLVITIMILGGDTALFKDYVIFRGKFNQVQGLSVGSVVTISGLKVGNITDIQLNDSAEIIVSFNVEKPMSHRVTDQSLATVKTQGALGDKYIFIATAPGTPLEPNTLVNVDNKPDLLDSFSDHGPDLLAISEVIKELNQLLASLNQNDRSALFMKNIVQASAELGPTIVRFRSILEKMDNGNGSLGALINDSALHDKLIGLLGDSPRNKYLKPLIRATIEKNEASK